MRLKDLAGGKTADMFNMPLHAFAIEPGFNARQDTPQLAQSIEELAHALVAGAWIPPLLVRLHDEKAFIVDGHRRFAAAKLAVTMGASIEALACVSVPRGTSEADRNIMMLSTAAGVPLTPYEQIVPIKRLVAWKWTTTQIAEKIGKTRQHVENILTLAEAPDTVLDMVRDGSVSATEAVKVVRREGDGAAATLAKAATVAKRGHVTAKALRAVQEPPAPVNGKVVELRRVEPAADALTVLREAVRTFLTAWEDDEWDGAPAQVTQGTVARLRELVA